MATITELEVAMARLDVKLEALSRIEAHLETLDRKIDERESTCANHLRETAVLAARVELFERRRGGNGNGNGNGNGTGNIANDNSSIQRGNAWLDIRAAWKWIILAGGAGAAGAGALVELAQRLFKNGG